MAESERSSIINVNNINSVLSGINGRDDITQEAADKLVSILLASSYRGLFEASLVKAAERSMLLDARQRTASTQGVMANRMLAAERRKDILHIAKYLIKKRSRPYSSISQLARDVNLESNGEYSFELVRKILGKENTI